MTEEVTAGEPREIINEPVVRLGCWLLLKKAQFGFARHEFAAFIVRNDDGHYWWLEWRDENAFNASHWQGQFPRGTVAIIHTHPNWLADPSYLDAQTARVTHVPVYVITRWKITATDGTAVRVVIDGNWRPLRSEAAHMPVESEPTAPQQQ